MDQKLYKLKKEVERAFYPLNATKFERGDEDGGAEVAQGMPDHFVYGERVRFVIEAYQSQSHSTLQHSGRVLRCIFNGKPLH